MTEKQMGFHLHSASTLGRVNEFDARKVNMKKWYHREQRKQISAESVNKRRTGNNSKTGLKEKKIQMKQISHWM